MFIEIMMNETKLDLLKTLVIYNRSKSMDACARELGLAQATVSKQLDELQKAFGWSLYVTVGRRRLLTTSAKELCLKLEDKLHDIQKTIGIFEQIETKGVKRTIRIGARREVFNKIIPLMKSDSSLAKSHLHFIEMACEEVVAKLLSNELDAGISQYRPDVHHIKCKKMFSSETQLAVHERYLNKLDLRSILVSNPEIFTQIPYLAYDDNSSFLNKWAAANKIHVDDFKIRVTTSDWSIISELVCQSKGFSLIPTTFQFSKGSGVQTVIINKQVIEPRNFYFLYGRHLGSNVLR